MINEAQISKDVKQLLDSLENSEYALSKQRLADGLATIIKEAIKSATITIPSQIPVTVALSTGLGATTSPATATVE